MPFQNLRTKKVIIRIVALRRSLWTERGDNGKRCVFSGLSNQHSFWTLKVQNHDLCKEGFVGVSLRLAQVFDHGGEISFTDAAFLGYF